MSVALDPHANHPHPTEEVRTHERTYHRFLVLVRYGVLAHLAAGTFIVLGFFTNVGLWAAVLVGGLILLLGIPAIRNIERPTPSTRALNLTMTTVVEEGGPGSAAWTGGRSRPVGEAEAPSGGAASYGLAARATVGVLYILVVGLWAAISIPSFLGILGALPG